MRGIHRRLPLVLAAAMVVALTGPAGAGTPPAGQATPESKLPALVVALKQDYSPDTVHVKEGQILSFGHFDAVSGASVHGLDQVVEGCDFPPLTRAEPGDDGACPARKFSAGLVPQGQIRDVPGVEQLPKGTYKFACRVHRPRMTGTLVVE